MLNQFQISLSHRQVVLHALADVSQQLRIVNTTLYNELLLGFELLNIDGNPGTHFMYFLLLFESLHESWEGLHNVFHSIASSVHRFDLGFRVAHLILSFLGVSGRLDFI
jgi:hypothetical protein